MTVTQNSESTSSVNRDKLSSCVKCNTMSEIGSNSTFDSIIKHQLAIYHRSTFDSIIKHQLAITVK